MRTKPTNPTISPSHLRKALRRVDLLNDEIIRLGLSRVITAHVDEESSNIPVIYVSDNLDYMGDTTVYINYLGTMHSLMKLPKGTTEADFWRAIVRA